MKFDPNNHVVKLCAEGMNMEGQGKPAEAYELFQKAWDEATNDLEKFTAAHYVARYQNNVADKLKWDETALNLALKLEGTEGAYPSLYLNIAKCYEDLNQLDKARANYQLALSYTQFLNDDGYGKMVKTGINLGLEKINHTLNQDGL